MQFKRPALGSLLQRLKEPRRFLQVLSGPRQTGNTTLARQLMDQFPGPAHYASADSPGLEERLWLQQQWLIGRHRARDQEALLVLDEVQKISGWSETVKRLLLAVEVKSGRRRDGLPGLSAFLKEFPSECPLLVGPGGVGLKEFLGGSPLDWGA